MQQHEGSGKNKEEIVKAAGRISDERRLWTRWQTLKIPFITGGPGPAETKRTTLKAAGRNLLKD